MYQTGLIVLIDYRTTASCSSLRDKKSETRKTWKLFQVSDNLLHGEPHFDIFYERQTRPKVEINNFVQKILNLYKIIIKHFIRI